MQIQILVEPVAGTGFRALSGPPLCLGAAATTRDEAIAKLRALIDSRIRAGAEIVTLDLPITNHPLAKHAGVLKDNPMLDEWKEAMAEYRRQRDAEEELAEDAD